MLEEWSRQKNEEKVEGYKVATKPIESIPKGNDHSGMEIRLD